MQTLTLIAHVKYITKCLSLGYTPSNPRCSCGDTLHEGVDGGRLEFETIRDDVAVLCKVDHRVTLLCQLATESALSCLTCLTMV